MAKYLTAVLLVAVMAATISIIDARSTDLTDFHTHRTHASSAFTDHIYATGMVEGATEDIHLRPEQPGLITEVLVAAGDWVESGDVLLRQDSERHLQNIALAKANLESAQAALERLKNGARQEERDEAHALHRAANARLEQAIKTWNRIQSLSATRAISQQEADDQRASVDALQAELEAAKARVKQLEAPAREDEVRAAVARVDAAQATLHLANIDLAKSELRSPCRGRVLDVNVERGELTGPNAEQPLIVLSDTSIVRVRAFVEELDAPRVQVGMSAAVTADGLPDKTFSGRVISLSPRMATKAIHAERPQELYDTKVREVLLELEETEEIIVGLRVDVLFQAAAQLSPSAAFRSLSAVSNLRTK
jgi:multidrug resistance efflux pump